MAIVLYDTDRKLVVGVGGSIVHSGGMKLVGECKRCGSCCANFYAEGVPCEHLEHEINNGEPRSKCTIQHNKPSGCWCWPLPEHILPKTCGFKWVGGD